MEGAIDGGSNRPGGVIAAKDIGDAERADASYFRQRRRAQIAGKHRPAEHLKLYRPVLSLGL
jgi:hypothetical protein